MYAYKEDRYRTDTLQSVSPLANDLIRCHYPGRVRTPPLHCGTLSSLPPGALAIQPRQTGAEHGVAAAATATTPRARHSLQGINRRLLMGGTLVPVKPAVPWALWQPITAEGSRLLTVSFFPLISPSVCLWLFVPCVSEEGFESPCLSFGSKRSSRLNRSSCRGSSLTSWSQGLSLNPRVPVSEVPPQG